MLSKQTVLMLIDLVENRTASMEVMDREDMQEMLFLQRGLMELKRIIATPAATSETADLMNPLAILPRRGRRRRTGSMVAA